MSPSRDLLLFLTWLAGPGTVGVVLFVLARRTRRSGMWWLFVALGVWPIASFLISRALLVFWARIYGASMYWVWAYPLLSIALVAVGVVLQIIAAMKLARIGPPLPPEPLCPVCGYNLTGLTEDRCPECATRFVCEVRYLTRPVAEGRS